MTTSPTHNPTNKECKSRKNLYSHDLDYQYPCTCPPSPAEEWEMELKKRIEEIWSHESVVDGYNYEKNVLGFIRGLITFREKKSRQEAKEEERARVREMLGKHNAEILNEFQLQMKPDLPMVCFDERIALIPAIEIATKKTLSLLNDNQPTV